MLNLYFKIYIVSSLSDFTKVIRIVNLVSDTLMFIDVTVIVAMQLSSDCTYV